MLEITVGHRPFSDQFQHLLTKIHFGQPNLLYIFNGMAIDNLQNVLFSKNGRPISDPYFYHCYLSWLFPTPLLTLLPSYLPLAIVFLKLAHWPNVLAFGRCMPGFLKFLLSRKSVCMCVFVFVCPSPRLLKTIHVK